MKTLFKQYKPRKIAFQTLISIPNWSIKIYTITHKKKFYSHKIVDTAIAALPDWLQKAGRSPFPVHQAAFLIVHEGKDGVWLLLNWWTGGEMVATQVYFAKYGLSEEVHISPCTHSLVCIWELEVFIHERKAWITHVLAQADTPDINGYLADVYSHT